jgi:small subunit ribosomal protein S7
VEINLLFKKIVYQVLDELEKKTNKPGIEVFDQALKNAMPSVEVKARRVGGATYQVPIEVKPARRLSLSIRWLVDAARSRSGMSLSKKLYQELFDAFNGEGVAVKKKEDTHRMAEANRAFAHYRW